MSKYDKLHDDGPEITYSSPSWEGLHNWPTSGRRSVRRTADSGHPDPNIRCFPQGSDSYYWDRQGRRRFLAPNCFRESNGTIWIGNWAGHFDYPLRGNVYILPLDPDGNPPEGFSVPCGPDGRPVFPEPSVTERFVDWLFGR